MRFRLVEEPSRQWPPSVSTLDAYDKLGSQKEQINFLKTHILPQKRFKRIFGVRPIVINCILKYGLDPKRNFFLGFLTSLTVEMPDAETYKQKMQYVYDAYENKQIDLKLPVLNNASLYSRNYKDFQYTLNAFKIFSDKRKASVYLKDTGVVDVSQFMDGDVIKPAGIDGRKGDTIYNVIEEWAGEGNEYSVEEIATRKQKEQDGKESTEKTEWSYEYFKDVFEKVFTNKSNYRVSLPKKNNYLEKAFSTFTLPSLKMPKTENTIQKMSIGDVKDHDVSKFGDPHQVDVPIPVMLDVVGGETIPGIFVFHKFVPMDDESKSRYETIANKNLGNLKRHLNNVSPTDDKGVNTHMQTIIDAFSNNGVVGISYK